MKDDYLWDKTGEDAEIQGLENALKAFRFQEKLAPPALPQKVLTLEKPKPRRLAFLNFGFGIAAFASLVVVLALAWFQFGGTKAPSREIVAAPERTPPPPETIENGSFIAPREEVVPAVKKFEKTASGVKPGVVKVRRQSAPVVRAEKTVLLTRQPKVPVETLTAEEKYAYDQLMLALSITGEKLRIVKDRIDGIEEQNAVVEKTK